MHAQLIFSLVAGFGPITVVLVSAVSDYFKERDHLKEGDKKIEAERKRELQTWGATVPNEVTHLLHGHPVTLDSGPAFRCDACTKDGFAESPRYTCKNDGCNFNLHIACGVSDEVFASWKTKFKISTSAHEHLHMELAKGSSTFTCSHCNNEGTSEDRYRCEDDACFKRIHPICANSPSMLISFLHPNHVLELKTRHHLQWCGICGHRGKSNARVYTCEGCKFFVHPECAHCLQCYDHHSHGHTLVYRKLPKRPKIRCRVCGKKCKRWNYTCPQCPGVAIHRECIGGRFAASGTKENTTMPGVSPTSHVITQAATEGAVQGLIGVVTGSAAS